MMGTDTERRQLENRSDQSDDLDSSNENYSSMVVALPGDITEFMILNKLDPVSFHCFGSVCSRLHSITIAAKKRLKPQLPWLMYNSCSGSDQLPKFFSLSGHGKLSRPKLVEACGIRCCGSSWGWLIMADERSCNNNNSSIIFLLNPFTRVQIQLPTQAMAIVHDYTWTKVPFTIPPSHHIRKALLLSPPTSPNTNLSDIDMDCVVVLISWAFDLYLCRLGDEEWTRILRTKFEDIILYHGQVYAITFFYDLVRVDLEGLYPKVISCDIAPPPPPPPRDPEISEDGQPWFQFRCSHANSFYEKALVESLGGELLMVIRRWCAYGLYPRTLALRVFRLDTEGQCWTQMENLLHHEMLFVGSGNAIALSALHYPNFTSGNCIYFTQQNFYPLCTKTVPPACQDTGVFHLEDKSIKPLFLDDDHDGGGDVTPPLIWFTPFSTS